MPDLPIMLPARSKAELEQSISTLEVMAMKRKPKTGPKNFNPSGKCARCPADRVPCSWLGQWLCGECFDNFAESEVGGAVLHMAIGAGEGFKYGNETGQDEGVRLKGYRR